MLNTKNKDMFKSFEQAGSYEEFWEVYEKFRSQVLKKEERKGYQDFATDLLNSEGSYKESWRRAFKLSMKLLASLVNEKNTESVMTRLIYILEKNMKVCSSEKNEKERFIVLDVCVDILEIMCDDKIHYPAALYDILQRTNIENVNCSSFYGQKAEMKVLERTYDDLEKVHKLDDYTRYNSYTAPFKRDFVNMLSLTRYRCEERAKNRKRQIRYAIAFIVSIILLCVLCMGYKKIHSEKSGLNEEFQELQMRYDQLEEQVRELSSCNADFENDNNNIKEENRKLIEENKKLEERLQKDKMEEEPVEGEESGNIERSISLVIQSEVSLYDRPDLTGIELLRLEKGTDVSVLEIMENGWYRVELDKKEGYIQYMNIPETN